MVFPKKKQVGVKKATAQELNRQGKKFNMGKDKKKSPVEKGGNKRRTLKAEMSNSLMEGGEMEEEGEPKSGESRTCP